MTIERFSMEIENIDDIKYYIDQIAEALYIALGFTGPLSLVYTTENGNTIVFTVRRQE